VPVNANGQPVVVAANGTVEVDVQAALQSGALVQGADGQTYLGVWIAAPEILAVAERPPMAMSLVIDRSGSMAGDKMENARLAAINFVSRLRNNDILSVYAYDDSVMEVLPPSVLEPATRELVTQRIRSLQPGGSTNIHGGLVASQQALARAPGSHPIRRTILVSDGLANVGPSSPEEIGMVGARGTDMGIQVTTIGVGMDYDERLMLTVAMRGAGRFYHLAEPGQMANILTQELDLMNRTVASGAILEIIPTAGVQILGAEGIEVRREGPRVLLPLGALYSSQRREVLLRVRADTSQQGQRALGQVRLRYADPDGRNERSREVAVGYQVTDSPAVAARSRNDRVEGLVQTFGEVRAQREASEMLNRGNNAAAAQVLRQQAQQMRAAGAGLAAPVRVEVERRARRLEEQSAGADRATSAPAARARALDFADAAAESSGY
jgi:Ca-activated chloride channel family protein